MSRISDLNCGESLSFIEENTKRNERGAQDYEKFLRSFQMAGKKTGELGCCCGDCVLRHRTLGDL